ncbi:MAG TPA: ABC transporter ATP-binding protein [Candidatus Lokiarchaeia archaeon]|nr:ABC transporter ATP-binding protein [Candidatus Lokiarchaeia archaeon]
MENNPIIEIKDLSFTYQNQKIPVLDGINACFYPGTISIICGPTGSGKTTLIRLLNGLIPHFYEGTMTGEVIVDGINTMSTSTAKLAQVVGMVFQNPDNQLVASSCEREIAFGPENLGLPRPEIKERVEFVMQLLKLHDIKDSSPNELSGGQKQKVAIASALALRPKILVFDEPTSNLDPETTGKLVEIIGLIREQLNTTIIIVEHHLEPFLAIATHVMCMNDGRIVLHDETDRVIKEDAFYELGVQVPVILKIFNRLIKDRVYEGPMSPDMDHGMEILRNLVSSQGPSNQDTSVSRAGKNFIGNDDQRTTVLFDTVSFQYPDGPLALKNVYAEIEAGSCVAIIGKNGAGKTTFVKCINGLIKPTSGKVVVDNVTTKDVSVAQMARKVGLVFQNSDNQLFATSVKEELEFSLKNIGIPEGEREQKIDDTLANLNLVKFKEKSPFLLSGGERKRVAIASLTCMNQPVFIADEPTQGQDEIQRKNIESILQEMQVNKKTVLIITHDLDFIMHLATRILIFDEGRILIDGCVDDVFNSQKMLDMESIPPTQDLALKWMLKEKGLITSLSLDQDALISTIISSIEANQ